MVLLIADRPCLLADTGPFCRFAEGKHSQLATRMLQQIEDIVAGRRRRSPGHFMEDRGEVATILLAKERGWPVLLDERWGTAFAVRKGVETVTTEELCVELAVASKLNGDHAYDVFKRVYRTGRAEFDLRVSIAERPRY
jgi:hypothetical protein